MSLNAELEMQLPATSIRGGPSRCSASLDLLNFFCATAACALAAGASAQLYSPGLSGQAAAAAASQSQGGGLYGQSFPPVGGASIVEGGGAAGQNVNGPAQVDAAATNNFTPVTISSSLLPVPDQNPVLSPTDGKRSGALYARPLLTPGQFELFQRPPPPLNEFELFVQEQLGEPLQRFGSNLLLKQTQGFAISTSTAVPPDYVLNPGDQVDIGLTGAAEANLRLTVDNEGKIFIPKIGDVSVAGLRYGDLKATLAQRISSQYRRVNVSVTISRLHGITVYVTGFATTPGAYTMSSLSTIIDGVLSAGGPSAGGSYRTIELHRGRQLVSTLDLYQLLFAGDKSHDVVLHNGDVLNILPTGPEMAILGSVNEPAIFEAKAGESLSDMLRFAGGFNGLADTSRIIVRSLTDLDRGGSRQLDVDALSTSLVQRGDVVRVLSLAGVSRPREREYVLATIEGEVARPGRYYMMPRATLSDLLAKAGGMTSGAFTYGTYLKRETVRTEATSSFDQSVANLELSAAAQQLQASVVNGGPAAAAARSQGALQIIQRLKQQRPDGRLLLNVTPSGPLPLDAVLENSDSVLIPPVPSSVGVFGASYRTGSFLFTTHHTIGDYLKLAGGPQRTADSGDLFVVRANGSILSIREEHRLLRQEALPGDVIFVPVRSSASLLDKILALGSALATPLVTGAVLIGLTR